jgi:hypothetical protein
MRTVRNITVCVSPDIYRQTRLLAAQYDTTVSGIVAFLLEILPSVLTRAAYPVGGVKRKSSTSMPTVDPKSSASMPTVGGVSSASMPSAGPKSSASMPIVEIEQKSSTSAPTSSTARPQASQPPPSPETIAAKALPAGMPADSTAPALKTCSTPHFSPVKL